MKETSDSNKTFQDYYNEYMNRINQTPTENSNLPSYFEKKSVLELKNKNSVFNKTDDIFEENKISKIMQKIQKFDEKITLNLENMQESDIQHKTKQKNLLMNSKKCILNNKNNKNTVHDLVEKYENVDNTINCEVEVHPIQMISGILPLIEKFDKDTNDFAVHDNEIKTNVSNKVVVPQNVVNCLNSLLKEKLKIIKMQKK